MTIKCSIEELPALLEANAKQLYERVEVAKNRAALDAVRIVVRNTPKAFGELRDSVHAEVDNGLGGTARTVVSAPHAAAVEIGSLPHNPDIEALVAWVKLRGKQALNPGPGYKGRGRYNDERNWLRRKTFREGPTTKYQSRKVGQMLAATVRRGEAESSPTDAPLRVAMAIAKGIREHGTKPQWFVKNCLPEIEALLRQRVRGAVRRRK